VYPLPVRHNIASGCTLVQHVRSVRSTINRLATLFHDNGRDRTGAISCNPIDIITIIIIKIRAVITNYI